MTHVIQSVFYTHSQYITATIDNVFYSSIPNDPANTQRRVIAEWEDEGNEIAAYVTPEPPTATTQLINRVQFKSMLALVGKTIDDVTSAIDASSLDDTEKIIAKIKVTDSDHYARNNPLFALLAPALGLSSTQIDTAWAQALAI